MHYLLLVIGDEVDRQLEPFADYNERERYLEFLDVDEIRSMAKHFGLPADDLEALSSKLYEWCELEGEVRSGRLARWTTENPDARFGWYKIGGNYDGYLSLLKPRMRKGLARLLGRTPTVRANRARKSEIDCDAIKSDPPAAFLIDGEWQELALDADQAMTEHWDLGFAEVIDGLPGDSLLTVVDVHS